MAGNFFFKFALDSTFNAILSTPVEMIDEMPRPDVDRDWFNSVSKTTKSITSDDDGNLLSAYLIMNPHYDHKWLITVHGYRSNAKDMGDYAHAFYDMGYNVLMPDLESHGLSKGKYVGMGYTDKNDVIKWINYIIDLDPEAEIVLHGVSMGASTVMMVTGESLPRNVKCAIEDCGYSTVYDIFKHVSNTFLRLPITDMLISALDINTKMILGYSIKEIDCVQQLKKSTTPTLFIHGDADTFVPFWMLDVVYNANPDLEKEKLVVNGATHACSSTHSPEIYFEKIKTFVEKYVTI